MMNKLYALLFLFGCYLLVMILWKIARWRALIAVFFMAQIFFGLNINDSDITYLMTEVYQKSSDIKSELRIDEFVFDKDYRDFFSKVMFWVRIAASIIIPSVMLFIWEYFFQRRIGGYIIENFSEKPVIGQIIKFKVELKPEHFMRWMIFVAFLLAIYLFKF